MAAVTMVKMMVMTTTTMTTTMMEMMMKKKMGNHVVGKWLKSLWQMGVLASLNVPYLFCQQCSIWCQNGCN